MQNKSILFFFISVVQGCKKITNRLSLKKINTFSLVPCNLHNLDLHRWFKDGLVGLLGICFILITCRFVLYKMYRLQIQITQITTNQRNHLNVKNLDLHLILNELRLSLKPGYHLLKSASKCARIYVLA
jgi:hypothetical protein